MAVAGEIGVGEIATMLNAHAEALGYMIFPNAHKAGGFLCVGSIHGEPGNSLKIQLRGPKAGTWADYSLSPNERGGKGDMLKLLQLTLGDGDMGRAVAEAKRYLALDTMDPKALDRQRERASKAKRHAEARALDDEERRRRNAIGLWQAAAPLTPSSPPVRYLLGRGIDFEALGKLPGAIRYRLLDHYETDRKGLPAMVTRLQDVNGDHVATHVTYLELGAAGWVKMSCPAGERWNKKIHGPMTRGAHIPLWKGAHTCPLRDLPAGVPVFCGEGIEDGLSYVMADPTARVIAAATLGNMVKLQLPPQAGDLVLLAQNDTNPEPLATLEAAVRAQQAQAATQGSGGAAARTVRIKRPPAGIKDWNDWLQAGVE